MTNLFDQPAPRVPVGHNHPETSHAAAEVASKGRAARAAMVIGLLTAARYDGLTCFQIEEATGWTHQATSGLLKPMQDEGRIAIQGWHRRNRRGRKCQVYATPQFHDPDVRLDPKPDLGPPPLLDGYRAGWNDGYAAGLRAAKKGGAS